MRDDSRLDGQDFVKDEMEASMAVHVGPREQVESPRIQTHLNPPRVQGATSRCTNKQKNEEQTKKKIQNNNKNKKN